MRICVLPDFPSQLSCRRIHVGKLHTQHIVPTSRRPSVVSAEYRRRRQHGLHCSGVGRPPDGRAAAPPRRRDQHHRHDSHRHRYPIPHGHGAPAPAPSPRRPRADVDARDPGAGAGRERCRGRCARGARGRGFRAELIVIVLQRRAGLPAPGSSRDGLAVGGSAASLAAPFDAGARAGPETCASCRPPSVVQVPRGDCAHCRTETKHHEQLYKNFAFDFNLRGYTEVRADESDIPACVGTASKDEFMSWQGG